MAFEALEDLTDFQKDMIGFVAYIILCVITFVVVLTFFGH